MTTLVQLENLGSITDLVSGIHWSGSDLRSAVFGRAALLKTHGFGPGDLAVITHGGSPHFFADLLALWQLGAGAACLNPALTENELQNVARFVNPKALLRGPGTKTHNLKGLREFDLAGEASPETASGHSPACDENGIALVLFTSGTTGNPKGVVHTFKTISARLENNWAHLSGEILEKTLCVLPTHFGHGLIGNCLTPLLAGHSLFLYPRQGIAGAADLGKILEEKEITFMSSVPSFWKVVLKASKKPEKVYLKQVSVGSAPLTADLWTSIQNWAGTPNVVNMYGITETANWAAGCSSAGIEIEDGLVGRMWGGEAAVLDEEGKQAPFGEGEIILKTPSVMAGYLNRPDLTEEVLQDGWYKTGDWGEISKDGIIRLKGRTKTEINKAGIKILPEEIDMLLESHPDVLEACAFAVPDPFSGETVAAALAVREGATLDPATIRKWCGERIRTDAVPEKWFFLNDIPKTDRGKVNRAMVRDFCLEGQH